MVNVSTKCKRLIYSGERVYIVDATIELSNGTVLEPSNSQIMSDGLELDDAVGSDDDFNCIGSTIVNGCNLILYNNDRVFSDYDFINAVVTIEIKIDVSDTNTPQYEIIEKGVFTVDEATWGDGTVTLVLLDNMCQFDRPYTSHNIYTSNTTIYDVVLDACTKCGVTIAGTMTNMPNKNFVVAGPPKDDTTYREVIGWCAAIAGCFARCTTDGKLEFAWFDVDKFTADTGTDGGIFDEGTPYYTSGDTVLGGTFNPWNDQYNVDGGQFTDRSGIHHISALTSQNIGVDDVVITDVQIAYEVETANSSETNYYPTTIADNRYVISIDAIPFINADNVEDFYDILADRLIGLTFRTCNVTQINDPTIEAGDIAWLWDTRGEVHKILITRTTFSITGSQTIICGAKTPARNSATQMTAIAKANARSNRRLNEEKSIRQQLTDNFNNYVANAKGLYLDKIVSGGTTIIYGHDKESLSQSKMVLKISNGAISMTADYKGTDAATSAANAWYGFQFDGTWIANIISTIGLNFDWGVGGALVIKDSSGNETFYANADTGTVRIKASSFSLASGDTINSIARSEANTATSNAVTTANNYTDSAITTFDNSLTQDDVFNRLTNNGALQGLYMQGNNLYVNASYIKSGKVSASYIQGGTLLLGGADNGNGKITVQDASGTTCGTWTNTGIHIMAGTISGATLTAGGSADGVITVQNASGTQIGRWDKNGIVVNSGSISGSVVKGGTLLLGGDGNGNGQIKVQDASGTTVGTWTSTGIHILGGTMNINNKFKVTDQGLLTATGANITGKIISQKTVGSDTLKLIIDDSDLRGYENSRLFGKLDLCAQSSDGQPHASLEGVKYLHLEAGTEITFNTGAIGGAGYERMRINNGGVYIDGSYKLHIEDGAGESNLSTIVEIPISITADGLVSSSIKCRLVEGILYQYY